MKAFKIIALLFFCIVVGVLDVLIYWNTHLYYQTKKLENNDKKIELLDKASKYYPFNDIVYYELGNAYFNLGVQSLDDRIKSEMYLKKSIENYERSIRINPASQFSHYNLGQALLYQSFLAPSSDVESHEEYRKAAILAGSNRKILFQIGKVFLSNWPDLSEGNKDFALGTLKKIVSNRDREVLESLMHIWEMNVKDYDLMKEILPKSAGVYRTYAKFLGEKSLSLEERQKTLAEAEFMEFEQAKNEYNLGENEFMYYRESKAFRYFRSSLSLLKKIRLYQNLTQQKLIDPSEFVELKKSTILYHAKSWIDEGKEFNEVEKYLHEYIDLEDRAAALDDLESYLIGRGLIAKNLGTSFEDLARMSFQLSLHFKKARYRDITRLGRLLKESLVVVPKNKEAQYVRILQIVGDAHKKNDSLYAAEEFYLKALELDPENLETLLKIRQNYENLNDEKNIRETNRKIDELLSLKEKKLKNFTLDKGRSFVQKLILDGRNIVLKLNFKDRREEEAPLVAIFFNNQVVWEGYLESESLSLTLESRIGENSVQIESFNRGISIDSLTYR